MKLIEWEVSEDSYQEQILITGETYTARLAITGNRQRFLFGDTSVCIDLENVRLKDSLRSNEDLRFLLIETTVLIWGEQIVMTDQREDGPVHPRRY